MFTTSTPKKNNISIPNFNTSHIKKTVDTMLHAYKLSKNQVKRIERVMKRGQLQINV